MPIKAIDRLLLQNSHAKSEQRIFEVYNKKFMKVTIKNLIEEKVYHINLSMLEPWPVRHQLISYQCLFLIVLFFSTTLVCILYLFLNKSLYFISLAVDLGALSLILMLASILRYLYCSPNLIEFRSRFGGIVLVSFLYNNPNQKEFSNFIDEFKNRILIATSSLKMPREEMLAVELKELRRLASESVFSDEIYATAKERIFKIHK